MFSIEARNELDLVIIMMTTKSSNNKNHVNNVEAVVTDFLRGPKIEQLRLQGIEHVYHITALEGKIYFRSYR